MLKAPSQELVCTQCHNCYEPVAGNEGSPQEACSTSTNMHGGAGPASASPMAAPGTATAPRPGTAQEQQVAAAADDRLQLPMPPPDHRMSDPGDQQLLQLLLADHPPCSVGMNPPRSTSQLSMASGLGMDGALLPGHNHLQNLGFDHLLNLPGPVLAQPTTQALSAQQLQQQQQQQQQAGAAGQQKAGTFAATLLGNEHGVDGQGTPADSPHNAGSAGSGGSSALVLTGVALGQIPTPSSGIPGAAIPVPSAAVKLPAEPGQGVAAGVGGQGMPTSFATVPFPTSRMMPPASTAMRMPLSSPAVPSALGATQQHQLHQQHQQHAADPYCMSLMVQQHSTMMTGAQLQHQHQPAGPDSMALQPYQPMAHQMQLQAIQPQMHAPSNQLMIQHPGANRSAPDVLGPLDSIQALLLSKLTATAADFAAVEHTDYDKCKTLTGMLASYVGVVKLVQETAGDEPPAKRTKAM
jgi:hypothetical protein